MTVETQTHTGNPPMIDPSNSCGKASLLAVGLILCTTLATIGLVGGAALMGHTSVMTTLPSWFTPVVTVIHSNLFHLGAWVPYTMSGIGIVGALGLGTISIIVTATFIVFICRRCTHQGNQPNNNVSGNPTSQTSVTLQEYFDGVRKDAERLDEISKKRLAEQNAANAHNQDFDPWGNVVNELNDKNSQNK